MRQVEKIMKLRLTVKRKIQLAAAIIIPGIILAGCQAPAKQTGPNNSSVVSQSNSASANKTQSTDQPAANEVQIEIENFVFKPAEITIAPGTKVTWINKDEAPHTATSTEQKFTSGGLDTDDKFSFVFNDKGDYPYFCSLHPHMKALIKVK